MDNGRVSRLPTESGQAHPQSNDLRVALVLWSGSYGGAETWSLSLAHAFTRRGVASGVVLVGSAEPLCDSRGLAGLPAEALRLARGADVISNPKAIASAVSRMGADAAIVPSGGYLSAAIRLGGYRGKIIAVEHGTALQLRDMTLARRGIRYLDMLSGLWAVDAQVVPSDFMLRELRTVPFREPLVRIYPGLDTSVYGSASPMPPPRADAAYMVAGFAGRLIRGKGLEVVLRALAQARPDRIRLEVAGEGPERERLEKLAGSLGITEDVQFRGWIRDMPAFWRGCDIAVVPSNEWRESFGMVAVEAMACGLPVLASRNGGLEEVIADGHNGALFGPGDWQGLSRLLRNYSADPALRGRHGGASVRRFSAMFDIDRCAEEFETFIRRLV